MNERIVTIVEGVVTEERWADLQAGFSNISQSPPEGILWSYIIQEKNEPTLWRLVTVWQSFELLQAMKQTYSTPPGIRIFKEVGVEPAVRIFDVKGSTGEK